MRALNRRERVLGGATLTAVLLAAAFQSLIAPQWSRHTRLRQQDLELQLALTRMQANIRLKDHIEARYDELKSLIRHSGTPSQEMSRFARLLTDLYRPLKLDIRSIRPLPDKNEGFYREFALHIEMAGSMDQLASFMAAVAQAPEPIRVERVELVCKERPDHVTASMIVTKVVTTQQPAAKSGADSPESSHSAPGPLEQTGKDV